LLLSLSLCYVGIVRVVKNGSPTLNLMHMVPQGLTEEQFVALSAQVREATRHLATDIHVHGSRAAGSARPTSDIDITIRQGPYIALKGDELES